jgi:hypothetical protein
MTRENHTLLPIFWTCQSFRAAVGKTLSTPCHFLNFLVTNQTILL